MTRIVTIASTFTTFHKFVLCLRRFLFYLVTLLAWARFLGSSLAGGHISSFARVRLAEVAKGVHRVLSPLCSGGHHLPTRTLSTRLATALTFWRTRFGECRVGWIVAPIAQISIRGDVGDPAGSVPNTFCMSMIFWSANPPGPFVANGRTVGLGWQCIRLVSRVGRKSSIASKDKRPGGA